MCQRLSSISCHRVPVQDPPKAIAAKYAGCLLPRSAPLPSLSFMGNSSMIFPLLCPLSSFKIQTVPVCQLSCLWLPLCLLLSSESFLSPLIFEIVRASPRHLFPHPSFVLIHGFLSAIERVPSVCCTVTTLFQVCWLLKLSSGQEWSWLLILTAQAVLHSSALLLYIQFCVCVEITQGIFSILGSWILLTSLNKFPSR